MKNGLTCSPVRAINQRLIGSSSLWNVAWAIRQRIVIGNLADAILVALVVVIVVGHLLIVAARHHLWRSSVALDAIAVTALAHAIRRLMIAVVVDAIAVHAVAVSIGTRSRIILILIVILLLQLLLNLLAIRDATARSSRRNRSALDNIAAHKLRCGISIRVSVAVALLLLLLLLWLLWWLMILGIVVDQIALLDCDLLRLLGLLQLLLLLVILLLLLNVRHVGICRVDRRKRRRRWRCTRCCARWRLVMWQRFGG